MNRPAPPIGRSIDPVQARHLLETARVRPGDPLHAAVVAPGGYGKSTLLARLARCYLDAGLEVFGRTTLLTGLPDSAEPAASVLIVDDAHQLEDDRVARLRELAERGWPRLVLGLRPWPRSTALRELLGVLSGDDPVVVLTPFTPDEVAQFVAAAHGEAPSASVARFLHAHTGGVPRYLARVVEAGDVAQGQASVQPQVPAHVVEGFRADLEVLDEDVSRFLIAAEAGAGHDFALLRELLSLDQAGVARVLDAARATGLFGQDGDLVPIGGRAVRSLSPVQRRSEVLQCLIELRLRDGQPVLELARSLLGTGTSGAVVARAFEAAAHESMPGDPALASTFFAAAAKAGRPAHTLAPGWAYAAALSGDLATALRLSDGMITAPDPAERGKGAAVAATVAAHRGELARSVELHEWSAGVSAASFGAIGLIGTGQRAKAEEALAQPVPAVVPTVLAATAVRMARGIHQTLSDDPAEALSTLLGAAALLEPAGPVTLLPDSPAALGAIVALHAGELGLAESVLARAIAARTGGEPLVARHRLLLGWVSMLRGELSTASAQAVLVRSTAGTLQPRDEMFLTALEAGVARRDSNLGALRRAWGRAYDAAMRHPVDLFTLLPLGEMAITAARLGEHGRLAHQLTRANGLLAQLDDPPLWTILVRWNALYAAITMEDEESAREQLAALAGHTWYSRYGSVLFTAAQSWLDVLSGSVIPEQVLSAAGELHRLGLRWDASRLAGQAAIRTVDRKAMVALLDAARQFQGSAGARLPGPRRGDDATPPAAPSADLNALSEREREVARLVVQGLTYKQVGYRLFISGKTVEHHMARIRAKLGATDRRELLATLRHLLGVQDSPDAPPRPE